MARIFNGTSDFASTTSTLDLSGTSQVTVSMWLWWDAFANDGKTAIELGSGFPVGCLYILPNRTATATFNTGLKGGVGFSEATFTRPSAAAWHHYVFIFDKSVATNEIVADYVDNVSQTLTRPNNSNNTDNFGNLTLYVMREGTSATYAAGRVADIGVWNTTLTSSQVTQLFDGALTSQIQTANLKASWRMKGSGTTEPDLSGNGNSLTYTGTSLVPDPAKLHSTVLNNYQFVSVGDGMSVSEKIR